MQLGFAAVEASAASYVEALARLSLFADLPHPQLEALAHSFGEEVFAEGQRVIRQDVTGGGFYVILDGEAKVVIDGQERARLSRGDFFGEISILTDERADRRRDRDVPSALPDHPRQRAEGVSAQAAERDVSNAPDRSAAVASRERLERLDERPFPPGEYDVVVVGSGPGGLQTAYSLARTGIPRCAVISRDPAPGGMFRRFPVYQRLISWTKPDAPFERGTREYEWYDHNSLVGDEREHQALAPEFMDRAFDVPARPEMEAALVEFAMRGGVRVRYGCEWLSTRRDDAGFVLGTSDGEYRCRVCVFAIGVTEPWVAPIPGLEAAPHYVAANAPERYQGKSVFIVGKRNSGFELAQGLLPWARRIVLGSPRPVDTAMLAFSPLSIRYLSPYTEHIRGGTGSYVVDAAIERVERHADGYRIHASGTTWEGELELESDEVIAATGFRAPVRDLPSVGVAMVNDGRMPAQTPYWESVSVPGIYFAGNVTQASPGLRKHGATSSSGSVNGFRYNARVLAQHIAEKHFGLRPRAAAARPRRGRSASAPRSSRTRPSSGRRRATSRGWSASTRPDGIRDEGIVPLADFVDRDGGDACAVAVEYDADGTVIPVVYVRRGGRLVEHSLPPHPLHTFGTDEHRRQLAACLAPLLSRKGRPVTGSA